MRKIIVDNQEVIIDEEDDRRKCKNVDADKVGRQRAAMVEYDDYGSETVTGGTTLKIETSPAGQEMYETTVNIGDTVYWGIKRA